MKTKRYKFLRTGLKSENGNFKWKEGQWYTCDQSLEMCQIGFHCSKGIYQAFSYIRGELLAEVEVKGKSIKHKDKECWQKMRIVKVWKWMKKDSILFSIYAANLVIKYFEKEYPNDDRPRKAIEAAQEYADRPTLKNKQAAVRAARAAVEAAAWAVGAVGAVRTVEAAEAAAWAAAGAAGTAAWAAARAVEAAAWAVRAARAAAWAAAGDAGIAAWVAAGDAIYKKLDEWMLSHLKELEKYEV